MFRLLILCALWTAVDGYKVAGCQPFQGPRNGQVSYTVREGGLVARFRCRRGYKLVGSPFAVCLGGLWRHPIPNCHPETNTFEQEEQSAEKRRPEPMSLALRNKSRADESVQNDSPSGAESGLPTPRRKYRKVANQTKKKKDKRKLKQRTKSKGSLMDGQSLEQDEDFLSKLDLSCLVGSDGTGFIKAPEISNAVVKYARRRNERKSQNRYLLATYECVKGFSLKNRRNDRMFCSRSRWLGSKPKCHRQEATEEKAAEASLCAVNRGGCEHVCTETRKRVTCSCYHGFRSEGNRCIDVDECEIDNGGCEHTCRNQLGSFSCSCPRGLQLSSNGKTCLDINECLSRNGHGPCQDTCTNHWGGYRCGCEGIPGTQLSEDNHTCEHLDECKSGMAGCSHSCINALGRAFCQCPPGLELGEDWKTCQDVDECDDEIIENTCEFGCVNTVGSYRCADPEKENGIAPETDVGAIDNCSTGYRRDSDGRCLDIDECNENLHNCSYRCINREGDYECLCPDGYDLNDNERTCDDYDECAEDLDTEHNCSQRCINEIGGYRCDCYSGYTLDSDLSTCIDVDECTDSPCTHKCINTIGGYRCGCIEGFQVENQTECIDVDECLGGMHNCSHGCTNTVGSYVCTCPSGMSLSDDNISCVDIDECKVDNGNCMHVCSNKVGGHQCECLAGYRLENLTACADIDECSDGSNRCSHMCTNTVGSYFCHCPEGYTLRQGTCEDVDECSESNGNCSHFCTNLQGSYSCGCPAGFQVNDFGNCKDINECLVDNGNCSHTCKNHEGSFECECLPGYEPRDVFACEDIDECVSISESNGGCSGTCENTDGSFVCGCPEGYALEPNGKICRDINECDTDNGNCSHVCINLDGSYRCSCPNNLKLEDNLTCTEVDLCLINNGGCEQICEMVNGSKTCACYEGYQIRSNNKTCRENENCFGCDENCEKMSNNVDCPCRENNELKQNRERCVDIDECENTPCQQICINTKGSYKCDCHDGYRLNDRDNKTCLDVDECLEWEYDFEYYDAKLEDGDIIGEFKHLCSHTCVNLPGGYTCYCPQGYVLHEDDRTCVDLNECEKDNGGCDHLCRNFDGGHTCECRPGFHLQRNKTCVDVDECSSNNGNCSQRCENTVGGFLCSCSEGYQMDKDNRTCKRDCSVRNGLCSAFCFETEDVPRCDCPPGFQLRKDNLSCEDTDECLFENGGCAQECKNTVGSFVCTCKEGYILEGNSSCSPIDGCSEKNGQCSHFCSYDSGHVACSCPKGYLLGRDGKTCVCPPGYFETENGCQDVDECSEGNGNCSGLCVNTFGDYRCECPLGFQLQGDKKSCKDVNECVRDNGGCAQDCVNTIGSYFCKCGNGFRLENRTRCTPTNLCEIENGGCAQICNSENGKVSCSCRQGYVQNGTNCEDVDECTWNHDCTQICINTIGSYQCKCKPGYKLDGKLCKDINECVIQRPCQEICINTLGSYKCVCPVGFKEENGKCKDINECEFENGNCTHKCINLLGSYKCLCPSGYEMENSSCKDVNECDNYNGGCDHICLNNEGSYTCNCRDNYYLSEDGKTCRAFGKTCFKLKVPNFGEVRCPQFSQSAEKFPVYAECYVRCHKGYKLIGDVQHICMSNGEWSGRDTECIPLPCPKLKAPENGHFIPSTCTTVKSPPSHHCILACNKGYHVQGRAVLTCLTSQQWNSPIPTCSKDTPPPYIQCSQDIKVELPSKKPSVYVKIPQPKSNVDWWRYVEAHPPWAKQLEGEFLLGTTTIMFQARNPNSNVTAACRLLIHVYDNEKPRVVECPDSFVVKLSAKEAGKIVTWKEPTFSDNVKIKHIDKSKEPGTLFKVGHHSIRYTATDTSGNQAVCHFTITVRQEEDSSRGEGKDSFKRFIICPNSIADHEFYSSYLVPARCFVQRHRLTKAFGGLKDHLLLQDHGVRHRHDSHDVDVLQGTAKNRSAAEKMTIGEGKFPKKPSGQQRKSGGNEGISIDRSARHRGNFPSDFRKIGTPFVDPRDLIDQKSHQSDLARWQDMVKKFQTSALPSAIVAGRDSDVRLVELETRRRLEEERLRNHEAEMTRWRENMKKYHVEMKRLQQGSRQQRTG